MTSGFGLRHLFWEQGHNQPLDGEPVGHLLNLLELVSGQQQGPDTAARSQEQTSSAREGTGPGMLAITAGISSALAVMAAAVEGSQNRQDRDAPASPTDSGQGERPRTYEPGEYSLRVGQAEIRVDVRGQGVPADVVQTVLRELMTHGSRPRAIEFIHDPTNLGTAAYDNHADKIIIYTGFDGRPRDLSYLHEWGHHIDFVRLDNNPVWRRRIDDRFAEGLRASREVIADRLRTARVTALEERLNRERRSLAEMNADDPRRTGALESIRQVEELVRQARERGPSETQINAIIEHLLENRADYEPFCVGLDPVSDMKYFLSSREMCAEMMMLATRALEIEAREGRMPTFQQLVERFTRPNDPRRAAYMANFARLFQESVQFLRDNPTVGPVRSTETPNLTRAPGGGTEAEGGDRAEQPRPQDNTPPPTSPEQRASEQAFLEQVRNQLRELFPNRAATDLTNREIDTAIRAVLAELDATTSGGIDFSGSTVSPEQARLRAEAGRRVLAGFTLATTAPDAQGMALIDQFRHPSGSPSAPAPVSQTALPTTQELARLAEGRSITEATQTGVAARREGGAAEWSSDRPPSLEEIRRVTEQEIARLQRLVQEREQANLSVRPEDRALLETHQRALEAMRTANGAQARELEASVRGQFGSGTRAAVGSAIGLAIIASAVLGWYIRTHQNGQRPPALRSLQLPGC